MFLPHFDNFCDLSMNITLLHGIYLLTARRRRAVLAGGSVYFFFFSFVCY